MYGRDPLAGVLTEQRTDIARIWTAVAMAAQPGGTGRFVAEDRGAGWTRRRRTDWKGGLCNDAQHASLRTPRWGGRLRVAIFHREIPNARAEHRPQKPTTTVNTIRIAAAGYRPIFVSGHGRPFHASATSVSPVDTSH